MPEKETAPELISVISKIDHQKKERNEISLIESLRQDVSHKQEEVHQLEDEINELKSKISDLEAIIDDLALDNKKLQAICMDALEYIISQK